MGQFFFYIVFIAWSSVFVGLLWSTTVLGAAMKNSRIPKKEAMWGINRGAFLTDPAEPTEIGKLYRQKAMVVELLLIIWGAIGFAGASIISGFSN